MKFEKGQAMIYCIKNWIDIKQKSKNIASLKDYKDVLEGILSDLKAKILDIKNTDFNKEG